MLHVLVYAIVGVNVYYVGLVCLGLDSFVSAWLSLSLTGALAHATPTGLALKLVPLSGTHAYWAAPHTRVAALVTKCAPGTAELTSKG